MAPESVDLLLKKTFTVKAYRDTKNTKFVNGKVVMAGEASLFNTLKKMKAKSSWLNTGKGMLQKKRLEYKQEQAAAQNPRSTRPSSTLPTPMHSTGERSSPSPWSVWTRAWWSTPRRTTSLLARTSRRTRPPQTRAAWACGRTMRTERGGGHHGRGGGGGRRQHRQHQP